MFRLDTVDFNKKSLLGFGLPTLFILLVVLFLLFLLVQAPSKYFKGRLDVPKQEVAENSQNVPEMSGILSGDQTARLKATRVLAQRVGPDQALEILKSSGLPYTGEGHLAVHQVGFYAYQKYGIDALLHCRDYFLSACYHGAIIEASNDPANKNASNKFDFVRKMTDKCRFAATVFFQCAHASGHGILAIWDYDLASALASCDEIFDSETQYPEALSSCHNGAFMENIFGVHDWGIRETPKRDWLSSDPYFPCSAFGEKYQKGCWLNQAARIYQLNNGDLVKTAVGCEAVPDSQNKAWCFDNLARQIHPLTEGNIDKVFSMCQAVGSSWFDNCVVVNAGSYYSVGDRDKGILICARITDASRADCWNLISASVIGDNLNSDQKKEWCMKLEGNFARDCFTQVSQVL